MATASLKAGSPGYQIFMLMLCLYALGVLVADVAVKLEPETRDVLRYVDYVVCALFFCDFLNCLARASDRKAYFFTWGWVDLLSSVPMVDHMLAQARWARAARAVRIFRVLRGLRGAKLLAQLVLQRRAENTFLAAALIALLLVVFSSVAILQFEGSNIGTAENAIWWAVATITTVGYGDLVPKTTEGRFVASILMCAGVGLFGTFSAFLAAWFLAPEEDAASRERESLRSEIAELRELLIRSNGRNPINIQTAQLPLELAETAPSD